MPGPGRLPIPVRELWREPRLGSLALSPSGQRAVTAVRDGEFGDWRIELYDLPQETVSTLATASPPSATISSTTEAADAASTSLTTRRAPSFA